MDLSDDDDLSSLGTLTGWSQEEDHDSSERPNSAVYRPPESPQRQPKASQHDPRRSKLENEDDQSWMISQADDNVLFGLKASQSGAKDTALEVCTLRACWVCYSQSIPLFRFCSCNDVYRLTKMVKTTG